MEERKFQLQVWVVGHVIVVCYGLAPTLLCPCQLQCLQPVAMNSVQMAALADLSESEWQCLETVKAAFREGLFDINRCGLNKGASDKLAAHDEGTHLAQCKKSNAIRTKWSPFLSNQYLTGFLA